MPRSVTLLEGKQDPFFGLHSFFYSQLTMVANSPVRLDGNPRASGIYDSIMAARAHGIEVPLELSAESVTDTLVSLFTFTMLASLSDGEKRF
jgi:hypothetical protein